MSGTVIKGKFAKPDSQVVMAKHADIEIPDEPEFEGDYQNALNELLHRLECYMDAFAHAADASEYDELCASAMENLWGARRALNRKQIFSVSGLLKALHGQLEEVERATATMDPSWTLVNSSLQLLRAWLDPALLSPRMDIAVQASTLTSRLAQYFQTAGHPIADVDLKTIDIAGGIVLSALTDRCETDEHLQEELDQALEMSTVFLFGQPPSSSGIEACGHDSLLGVPKAAMGLIKRS
jgi:hypothetical protein